MRCILQKVKMAATAICLIACVGSAATWYVDASRPDDNGPGTSLATAWQIIQTAVDNASSNDVVLVAPGVYTEGGTSYNGASNRVDVDKAILVKAISTNHADTVIVGGPDPGTAGRGPDATRGVYLRNGGAISGFTITNGYAGNAWNTQWGGGICMLGTNTTASNCVIVGNCSDYGAIAPNTSNPGGVLYNSVLRNNIAGAAARSRDTVGQLKLVNCALKDNTGNGAQTVTLINCTVTANGAVGCWGCLLVSCVVTGHTATYGAGATGGQAVNCTITGNYAGHAAYGAADNMELYNCISWGNYYSGVNYNYNNISRVDTNEVQYCCIGTNFDGGVYDGPTNVFVYVTQGDGGNIIEDPQFTDPGGDFHVKWRLSPCLNAGNNFYIQTVISNHPEAAFDMDGNPRVCLGAVDMGAYEYEPPPMGSVVKFF